MFGFIGQVQVLMIQKTHFQKWFKVTQKMTIVLDILKIGIQTIKSPMLKNTHCLYNLKTEVDMDRLVFQQALINEQLRIFKCLTNYI